MSNNPIFAEQANDLLGEELAEQAKDLLGEELAEQAKDLLGEELAEQAKELLGKELAEQAEDLLGEELAEQGNDLLGEELAEQVNDLLSKLQASLSSPSRPLTCLRTKSSSEQAGLLFASRSFACLASSKQASLLFASRSFTCSASSEQAGLLFASRLVACLASFRAGHLPVVYGGTGPPEWPTVALKRQSGHAAALSRQVGHFPTSTTRHTGQPWHGSAKGAKCAPEPPTGPYLPNQWLAYIPAIGRGDLSNP
ncbi:hypothetical protein PCANC_16258 [Puccinia coronata f. sp. avenae]|uniref:Uncharacterized protein n=1 Tax=Puccinia coronata f. sp. avenae TaxID=200324 RepID=A0A2N5U7P8_9BASI|nr:hypothetical protein PCANC_16258 [Puccinia coronata f. sp. avenae]